MQCPRCTGTFDKRIKGPNFNVAFFLCSTCGYSRTAREGIILKLILDDYAEEAGVDPTKVKANPKTTQELKECLDQLLKSRGLSSLH